MATQREMLDTDAKAAEALGPTVERTAVNRHEVVCAECAGYFYVDDATYERVLEALSFHPASNPFLCDECEAEYAAAEHGH